MCMAALIANSPRAGFGFLDKRMQAGRPGGDVIGVAMQRAGVLAELPGLLTERGVDADALLASHGIAPRSLDPDSRLPFVTVLALLDAAATATGLPHLGLLLGMRFRLGHHGPLGRLMAAAPTLGQALEDFVAWQPGYSSGAIVYLLQQGDVALLGYGSQAGDLPGSRPLQDAVIGVGACMVRALTGGAAEPIEAQLAYRQPADGPALSRIARLPLRFGQVRTCVMLEGAALNTRLPGADAALRRQILAGIAQTLQPHLPDLSGRVRGALRLAVQQGTADLNGVAAGLGLHPRSLRRHLAAEGQSFSRLQDEVRFALARDLLAGTDLPVGEIGAVLGFAAPGVFSESFRRWSGSSPTVWRRSRMPPGG